MNTQLSIQSSLTMSSRDIAELTKKQHQHVKRDIEVMLRDLGEDVSNFGRIYLDSMSRRQTEYLLDRDHVECLITGYSSKLRIAVIRRLRELESVSHSIPKTLSAALRLAADQQEQIEAQSAIIEKQKPAVEFVESYVESSGLKGFREVAKLLKIKEPVFRKFLQDNRIMYVLGRQWTAYQNHLDAGRFEVKTGTSLHADHTYNAAKFTPKGVNWVANLWANSCRDSNPGPT